MTAMSMSQGQSEITVVMKKPLVPLSTLIGRDFRGERNERSLVKCGQYSMARKGEDYYLIKPDCIRVPGDPLSSYTVFAVLDGHNGVSAAIYTKENLLNHVLSVIPEGIEREEWLQRLPQALVAGFVKTDMEFQRNGELSGTTATFVIIDGLTVTVACVGDSRCVLDTQGDGDVTLLTVDHRLEENVEERERVTASGGEVARLNISGSAEVGPLRCWPGGLCLSRSIGDMDVGEFIVPVPHVKQVKLSKAGGRIIIASDGIWDALSNEKVARSCRGLPADLAAKIVVKQALNSRGLKDDTTCLVVDIIPPECSCLPAMPRKKQNFFSSLFRLTSRNRMSTVGVVEDIFEEGSAMLAERLGKEFPWKTSGDLFKCAICQENQPPSDGLPINSGPFFSSTSNPWEGPYFCNTCREKKDAMEGKLRSRPTVLK